MDPANEKGPRCRGPRLKIVALMDRQAGSGAVHILGLQALGTLFDFELHLGPFLEGPVSGHLDRGEVDKHILAAGPLDESIALGGVKPFHGTLFSHCWYLLFHSREAGTL